METAVLHYRYPGSRPFQDTDLDRRLYFGREYETQLLLHTVLAERLTVLFAKSGMGKTSLLNAGIMQLLRDRHFLPFVVRFNFPEMNPLEAVYEGIKTAVQQTEGTYNAGKTLLDYFSSIQFSSFDLWRSEEIALTPVLILDQFEEFFTLHAPEKRDDFIVQFAALVRKRTPEIKIIVSVREDYLGQLEEIAKELPDIFQNRFRISALTREQAKKAIEEPARVEAQEFQTTSFQYAPETIDAMLDFLCKQRKRDEVSISDEVEPFQLQLLCQHVENFVSKKSENSETKIIREEVLGGEAGMRQILQTFYSNQINKLSTIWEKRHVRKLCQKGLISPTDRRLPLEEEEIERRFKVSRRALAKLVDGRLLRAESRLGSIYYELSHDTLVEPIRAVEKKRRTKKIIFMSLFLILTITVCCPFLINIVQNYRKQQKHNEGLGFEQQGRFAEAIKSYEEAIQIDPCYLDGYYDLGRLYFEQDNNEYEDAKKYFEEAIEVCSKSQCENFSKTSENNYNCAYPYIGLGQVFYQQKEYGRAIKNFLQATEIYDTSVHANKGLGDAYYKQNEYDKAIKYYEKTLEYGFSSPDIYTNLGNAFFKIGNHDEAIQNYQKVDSKDLGVLMNLAEVTLIKGYFREALDQVEKIGSELDKPMLIIKFLRISSLIFQGEQAKVVEEVKKFIVYYTSLLSDAKEKSWDYTQMREFIKDSQKLTDIEKRLLFTLIDILESPKPAETDRKRLNELELLLMRF